MNVTKRKDRWDLRELAEVLGCEKVIDSADNWEYNEGYGFAYKEALKEGKTEEEAEEEAQRYEQMEMDDNWKKLMNGFDQLLEKVAEVSGITFVKNKKGMYRATSDDWQESCEKIIEIINGVGMFYFRNTREFKYCGPYSSYRQAALAHLHWIKSYPEVYGDRKFSNIIYSAMRY